MSLEPLCEMETRLLRWECQNARSLVAIFFTVPVLYWLGFALSPGAAPWPWDSGYQHALWTVFGKGWGGTTTLIAAQLFVCWGALRYIRFMAGAALAALRSSPRL